MVGECYTDLRCCEWPVFRSVCSCVLDEPVIWQRAILTHLRFVYIQFVAYVMFLTRRDLNFEPRVYWFNLSTGFRI